MDVSDGTPIEPGRPEPELVEDALGGGDLGVLEQIWAGNPGGDLDDEQQALALAVAEQHAQRRG